MSLVIYAFNSKHNKNLKVDFSETTHSPTPVILSFPSHLFHFFPLLPGFIVFCACCVLTSLYITFHLMPSTTDGLHHSNVTGNELERALRKIGREDVIRKCMYNVEEVMDPVERAVAKTQIDQAGDDGFSNTYMRLCVI